jgi:hypothetical protein
MASSTAQRQRLLVLVWVTVTAALAISVQTFGVGQAFGDNGAPAPGEGIAVDYPLSPTVTTSSDAPSALYAGLLWSVTGTRVTPAEGFLGRAEVEVDLEVTNTLQRTPLRASEKLLALVTADGTTVPGAQFHESGTRLSLEPGETKTATASFEVGFSPDPDPATLSLRIAELSRVPALIPLGGAPAPAADPVFAAVDTTTIAVADPDRSDRKIAVTPTGATIDVNAGPYRALEGKRMAVVKVVVQRAEISQDSTFLTAGYWSLDTSAGPVAPVLVAKGRPAAANADEVTLVFAFPADAQHLSLVAAPGAEAARFQIALPAAG